ncbi:substrate-binding domain-containing protein [Saccharopolyspora endophytica]|uniref:Substrate-binding domain-containing protein n=1 Tax=Saccharopolyspora endophytica TaxID=543886 RepID=A0ABS5DH74_9PSEU|nr:substrate-binding domain-containing protein [Saccharopolyspora endophytica]MBQ0925639.1 substrate-binding domain-containing protein [Saccharopolyspora endophytica]
MQRRRYLSALALLSAAMIATSGCSYTDADVPVRGDRTAAASLEGMRGQVLSKGPYEETPALAGDISLTPDEVAKVRSRKATAAISMHYTGDDWTAAQLAGMQKQFDALGIKVIAVTDANRKPEKQVSDIETIMAKHPDILVSIPTDGVATAKAFQKAADEGVHLVFMDNVPKNMKPGNGYVSVVSADNFGNGVVSAHLMADALGGRGKIGVVFYQSDYLVTQRRYDGFTSTIKRDYPGIQIVEEKGFSGPDYAGQSLVAANAMVSKHPDLAGIWGVWDIPTEGIVSAARSSERPDLVITTQDLGKNVAIAMARQRNITGLGAQRPYDQGVTEATLGAYGLIGKPAPPFVALAPLAVTRDNLAQAWREVYRSDAPPEVQRWLHP